MKKQWCNGINHEEIQDGTQDGFQVTYCKNGNNYAKDIHKMANLCIVIRKLVLMKILV